VKATDNLVNGILKGVYKPTVSPTGSYVQYNTNDKSFSPVQNTNLYLVSEGKEISISPFRAYATQAIEQDEPDDPKDPYILTVTSAGIATVYLDFDAVIPDEDFFLVAAVTQIDGTAAYLKEVKGGIIPANTGVMIFANPGTYKLYPSEVEPTEEVTSLLHGVLVDTPVSTVKANEDGAAIYVLSRGIEEYTGFKVVGSTVKSITANKAYLPIRQTVEVKEFIYLSYWGQVVTGIDDIMAADNNNGKQHVIYDLSGRRVNDMKSGIYIVNGKKVLIK
jgi:hypothetical protein